MEMCNKCFELRECRTFDGKIAERFDGTNRIALCNECAYVTSIEQVCLDVMNGDLNGKKIGNPIFNLKKMRELGEHRQAEQNLSKALRSVVI